MLKKLFFLGVKKFYAENRIMILSFIASFSPAILVCVIRFLGVDYDFRWLLLVGFLLYIFLSVFLINYLHFTDAREYLKKHNVSFKEAWFITRPIDNEDDPII